MELPFFLINVSRWLKETPLQKGVTLNPHYHQSFK